MTYSMDKANGLCQEYYENGKLKTELTTLGGKRNGSYAEYFENGKPKITGEYKLDEKVGEWKEYNDNGYLLASTLHGKKLGDYNLVEETKFFDSGAASKTKCTYVYGWQGPIGKIGDELFYDSTGVLYVKNTWNKDNISDPQNRQMFAGTHEDYYPNGKLKTQASLRYEAQSDKTYYIGTITEYYENGNKKHEYQLDYNSQFIEGTEKSFNEKGEQLKK